MFNVRPLALRFVPFEWTMWVGAPVWTAEEYAHLRQVAREIGVRPVNLLLVLYAESGLDPHADNGIAKGLNQITWTGAKGWLTEDQWRAIPTLTVHEQLPLVSKSFQRGAGAHAYRAATDLYQANFAPATLQAGSGDDVVLYRSHENGGSASEDQAYHANIGLDTRGKGQIEVGDLRRYLVRTAAKPAFEAHRIALGDGSPDLEDLGSGSWGFFFGGVLGLAGVGLYRFLRG